MARVVREVRPRFVFVENSPMLTVRGLGRVLGDLATMGYDARWCVLGADDVGAPHRRKRIWILADAHGFRRATPRTSKVETAPAATLVAAGEQPGSVAISNGKRRAGGFGNRQGRSILRNKRIAEKDKQERTQRERWFGETREAVADAGCEHEQGFVSECSDAQERKEPGERSPGPFGDGVGWWDSEPGLGRVAHGIPDRILRLTALGNAQVPLVAATAWRILTEGF